jgi:hypothetical protein
LWRKSGKETGIITMEDIDRKATPEGQEMWDLHTKETEK